MRPLAGHRVLHGSRHCLVGLRSSLPLFQPLTKLPSRCMATASSSFLQFEGTVIRLKGSFTKEHHASSTGGRLEFKIMEFQVDDDDQGWETIKAATRSLPPPQRDSSVDPNFFWLLTSKRKNILQGESRVISVLGKSLSFVKVGTRASVTGSLSAKHSQVQMMVNEVSVLPPETNEQFVSMLMGMMDGVGETTAKAMVSLYGKNILNVLSSDDAVKKLTKVPRVGVKTAQKIKNQWDESGAKTLLHQKLQSTYGLLPLLSFAVVECLTSLLPAIKGQSKGSDEDLIEILRLDPYKTLMGVNGVSFMDAENLASKLGGVPSGLLSRASFAILQALASSASDGNTHTLWSKLKTMSLQLLKKGVMGKWDEEKQTIALAVINLSFNGFIILEQMDESGKRTLVTAESNLLPETRVYFKLLHHAEAGLSKMLAARVSQSWDLTGIEPQISSSAGSADHDGLTAAQSHAVKMSSNAPIMLLAGGAGCGKTSTCRVIISSWIKSGKKVAVCAPTGRASQRIQEAMGEGLDLGQLMPEASTIHRLLGCKGASDQDFTAASPEGQLLSDYIHGSLSSLSQHDASNPLDVDCVLVDEASMLDLQLAYALFQALPQSAQVLLVGDPNQLPPVSCGHVLSARLSLKRKGDLPAIPQVHLDQIFRQDGDGSIVGGALQIMNGQRPTAMKACSMDEAIEMMNKAKAKAKAVGLSERLGTDSLLIEIPDSAGAEIEEMSVSLANSLKGSGIDVRNDLQLLSPLVKISSSLNSRVQTVMNPRAGGKIGLNDRVIQTTNNYDKDVFNGDLGRVTYLSERDKIIKVAFPRRDHQHVVEYQGDSEREIQLAWSTTVHKSQGGEYPYVIVVLDHNGLYLLGSRQLLYTAVTRARQFLILLSTSLALRMCLKGDVASSEGGGGLCIAKRVVSDLHAKGYMDCSLISKPQTPPAINRRTVDIDLKPITDTSNRKWAARPNTRSRS